MKRVINYNPFSKNDGCSWLEFKGTKPPFVVAFRKRFAMSATETVRIQVAADERYELFLDGRRISRGPERGDAVRSFFDTLDLEIEKGEHVWVAKVWALGEYAPLAQLSHLPGGFLLCPEEMALQQLFGTGISQWDVRALDGFTFAQIPYAFGIGWRECIDGEGYDGLTIRHGDGDGWTVADPVDASRVPELMPATLPAMLDRPLPLPPLIDVADLPPDSFETSAQIAVGSGKLISDRFDVHGKLDVPPNTVRRFVFRFEDYFCVYPEIRVSGGRDARMRIGFSEAACLEKNPEEHPHFRYPKGARDHINGKYLLWPISVTCRCSGKGNLFDPLWWFAGRYLEITVETQEEALCIEDIDLFETRYPLQIESHLDEVSDEWREVLSLCERTLQMCAHETYMDCPFYEQLMYVGDTRLQALTTYALSRDAALPRKAIETFHASRLDNGLTGACHPYRGRHQISPFSLWWIAMIHDYALWRDPSVVTVGILDHMRSIMDWFSDRKNIDGLVVPENIRRSGHFNFIDWVEVWNNDFGVPPGEGEFNAVLNAQWILVLKKYVELEEKFGDSQRAKKAKSDIRIASAAFKNVFWDESRGLFADDPAHTCFSEHTQCLAILAELLPYGCCRDLIDQMGRENELAPVSFYFAHYYFEACAKMERMDLFERKMEMWRALVQQGFCTVPETPEPSRSDCHAWGAHPLFHFYASILGIRPASFGFQTVSICPQLGALHHLSGRMAHPQGGVIAVNVEQKDGMFSGTIILPDHLSGQLVLAGETRPLGPGMNVFKKKINLSEGVSNEVNDRLACGLPCAGV